MKINLEIPPAEEPTRGWTVDPEYLRNVAAIIEEKVDYWPTGMEEIESVILALVYISKEKADGGQTGSQSKEED